MDESGRKQPIQTALDSPTLVVQIQGPLVMYLGSVAVGVIEDDASCIDFPHALNPPEPYTA